MDGMTPPVTFEVSFEDAKAFWAGLKRRKPRRRGSLIWSVFFYVAVFLALCAALRQQVEDSAPSPTGIATFGVLVGIAGVFATAVVAHVFGANRAQRRDYDGMMISRGPITACADQATLEVAQAGAHTVYTWACFVDLRATPSLFLLFVAKQNAVIIPRRAVSGTPFGALVEERCAHGIAAPWNP